MRDFVNYAIRTFEALKWKPAQPNTLSKNNLIVYGNLDSAGYGTHCVIDPDANLLKVAIRIRSFEELFELKLVGHFDTDIEGCTLLDKYLDIGGGLVKDMCK